MNRKSVTLVEDNPETVEIIRNAFEVEKYFKIQKHFTSAEQFLESPPSLTDLFIFDIHLPNMSGVELLKKARAMYPDRKITMYTAIEDEHTLIEAIQNGANGYILKESTLENLCRELHVIMEGGASMTVRVAQKLIAKTGRFQVDKKIKQLTEREMEILNLIAIGMTYHDIAEDMEISVNTVRNHLAHIYDKLGVQNRHQASKIFERNMDPQP
ncbi:MAG: response regulator transcription factor [Spirochaetia bacterium]|nr:response regulator transcription factor [Spirochaetia bacterium]